MASASSTPRSKGNDEVSRTSSPTPRTKIKALLATVDSDSDSKASPSAKEASHSDKAPSKPATSRENHDVAPDASSSGEDTDEEALFRPRGLAARMRVANSGPERQTGTTDAEESARDRVRRLLQLGNSSPEAVDKSPRQPAPQGHEDALRDRPEPRPTADSDEDDDVVGATRARTTRRARPAASSSPQSERLFVSPTKSDAADAEGGAEVIIADVDADADADGETDSDDDVAGMSATGGQLVKKKDRFLALVARKRREREEAEAEAARQEAERRERLEQQLLSEAVGSDMDADDDIRDISDDEGGRRLTQDVLARPAARKASKKALEEMNRETQRMSRSLQLAHEAKTKKKITKAALFERFNYRPQGVAVPAPAPVAEEAVAATSSSRPVTPRSAGHSDTEARDCDTPPSSPPLETAKEEDRFVMSGALPVTGTDGEGATDRPSLDAGESKDVPTATSKEKEADAVSAPEAEKKDTTTVARPAKRQFRVKLPILNANLARTDADDELEITVPKKSKLDAIFDSVPAQDREESRSLLALRRLAHLSSPPREGGGSKNRAAGGGRTSMTPGELQALLRLRAREQAREERERRLEMLRAKGVVLQTEEERERELAEVEDIVARARREAEEIMRREAEAAKKEKKAAGEDDDPLALDDSDDESYEEAAPELKEVELSGSEEEAVDDEDEEENEDEDEDGDDEDEEMEDAGDEANEALPGGLYDDEADETDADDEDATNEGEKGEAADAEEGSDEDSGPVAAPARSRNRRRHTSHAKVVSDDEDEDAVQVEATPRPPSKGCFKSPPQAGVHTDSPRAPTSVLRSATKPFIPGLPVMGAAGLGLTQIFQGTMDDSQAGSGPRPTASSEVMMPDFDAFPSNNLSTPSAAVVPDSQRDGQRVQVAATPGEGRSTENAPVPMFGSPFVRDFLNAGTQSSEFIEATQDVGFQARSPMKERFIIPPASTVGTVVADSQPAEQHDSPLVQRKGKLRRKTDVAADIIEQADSDDGLEGDELPVNSTSAFSVMKEAAKKPKSVVQFDKKKSTAKEMVEDEAEESEDEYAGLGGVDGEDSSEDEGSVKDMIDDKDAGKVLDERKIAAFHA